MVYVKNIKCNTSKKKQWSENCFLKFALLINKKPVKICQQMRYCFQAYNLWNKTVQNFVSLVCNLVHTFLCHVAIISLHCEVCYSLNLFLVGMVLPENCTDQPWYANCQLIIKGGYCTHQYFKVFCCKSCHEAGKLPWSIDLAAANMENIIGPARAAAVTNWLLFVIG